jgi:hypothetical protein
MVQIEWSLRERSLNGEVLCKEFRPSEMQKQFEFFIENMDKLNLKKFTEKVLRGSETPSGRPRRMAPDDDEDEDEDEEELA